MLLFFRNMTNVAESEFKELRLSERMIENGQKADFVNTCREEVIRF